MEIEQKERKRIEALAYRHRREIQDKEAERIGGMNECIMLDAMKHESGYKVGAEEMYLHLQKEVIQPKDKRILELEAENKALREMLTQISAWLSFNTNPSAEELGKMKNSIDQLLTKNVVKPGDAELNATTDL